MKVNKMYAIIASSKDYTNYTDVQDFGIMRFSGKGFSDLGTMQ